MRRFLNLALIMVLLLVGCSSKATELPSFGGTQLNQQRRYVDEYFVAHEGKVLHLTLRLTDLSSVDRNNLSALQVKLYGTDQKLIAQFLTSKLLEYYCWIVPSTGVYRLEIQTEQEKTLLSKPLVEWAIGESSLTKLTAGQLDQQKLDEIVYFHTQRRPYSYFRHSKFYQISGTQNQSGEISVTSGEANAEASVETSAEASAAKEVFKPLVEVFSPDGQLVGAAHPECEKPQLTNFNWPMEKTGNYLLAVTGYLDPICPIENSQFVGLQAYGLESALFQVNLNIK